MTRENINHLLSSATKQQNYNPEVWRYGKIQPVKKNLASQGTFMVKTIFPIEILFTNLLEPNYPFCTFFCPSLSPWRTPIPRTTRTDLNWSWVKTLPILNHWLFRGHDGCVSCVLYREYKEGIQYWTYLSFVLPIWRILIITLGRVSALCLKESMVATEQTIMMRIERRKMAWSTLSRLEILGTRQLLIWKQTNINKQQS